MNNHEKKRLKPQKVRIFSLNDLVLIHFYTKHTHTLGMNR